MNIKSFVKECHEKEVFKMLSIYIFSCWIILQVLSVIEDYVGLPKKSITVMLIIMLIGFPINIFYIWKHRLAAYELEHSEVDKKGRKKKSKFQKMYFSAFFSISLLSALTSLLIINNTFIIQPDLPEVEASDKIAILKFGNNTGDSQYDVVSKMASNWIMHGITENRIAQVVSPENVEDYAALLNVSTASTGAQTVLEDYFKPKKIISGNFFLKDDKLLFQSSISDEDETFSFKLIECDKNNPLEGIEALKQLILGYLKMEKEDDINIQDTPPKFEAYQALLQAREANDRETRIALLIKAIELDSTYFEPKTLLLSNYYNQKEFKKADSLRLVISRNLKVNSSRINKRQKNLFNWCEALLNGQNDKVYSTYLNEYKDDPFNLQTNKTFMVLSMYYVNKPKAIDSIYFNYSIKDVDIAQCRDCVTRLQVKSFADNTLKRYDTVIKNLEPFTSMIDKDKLRLHRQLITAYLSTGKLKQAEDLLNNIKMGMDAEDWQSAFLEAGKRLLLLNRQDEAAKYFDEVVAGNQNDENLDDKAEALYFLQDYQAAELLFKEIYSNNPKSHADLVKLAICYYKNDKKADSEKLIDEIDSLRTDYQFGAVDYVLAQYYAVIGDEKNMMLELFKSVTAGSFYSPTSFQNDPHFKSFIETPSFNKLLTFWH